jgi:hypothetical protein
MPMPHSGSVRLNAHMKFHPPQEAAVSIENQKNKKNIMECPAVA